MTPAFQWLHTISFFHAAFEALAVNELRYLQLKEVKVSFTKLDDRFVSCSFLFFNIQYGVELDLPAATILSMFGLRAQVISSLFFFFYKCPGS